MTISYHPWVTETQKFKDNPPTPDDIVKYVRTWVGARWKHQGRGDGPARQIDCAGLLQRIMARFGMKYQDVYGYGRAPEPAFIEHIELLTRLGDLRIQPHGGVGIFSDGVMPCHVGFLATDKGMTTVIHAEAYPKMRVYECALEDGNPSMGSKLAGFRWFNGVDYV